MSESDLSDLRAIEIILNAMAPLNTKDQVRVLTWVIEKLDLGFDMRLAIRDVRSIHRSYIDLAWERAPHMMDTAPEFVSAANPRSMADRVVAMATFLQMKSDDPDRTVITGREINAGLRNMQLSVRNVADCIYTLMKRTPPHMVRADRPPNHANRKAYRVTESGINYVYQRIAQYGSEINKGRTSQK